MPPEDYSRLKSQFARSDSWRESCGKVNPALATATPECSHAGSLITDPTTAQEGTTLRNYREARLE